MLFFIRIYTSLRLRESSGGDQESHVNAVVICCLGAADDRRTLFHLDRFGCLGIFDLLDIV